MLELSKVTKMVLKDRRLKKKIAAFCGVTETTVYDWLRKGSGDMLRLDILTVISEDTGIPVEELTCKVQPEVV